MPQGCAAAIWRRSNVPALYAGIPPHYRSEGGAIRACAGSLGHFLAGQLVNMGDRCLIVAPHPDDETIGAGIWMHRHRNCEITLLHITDGSPRDPADAKAVGFPNRRAYAAARRRELHAALSLVGVRHSQLRIFSYGDKETYQHLPELVARMTALIDQLRPTLVLSPAYEGGHPDHDS